MTNEELLCHIESLSIIVFASLTHFCSNMVGLNFISLYTHVQNDNVINTNEKVNDIQNGIQKEV